MSHFTLMVINNDGSPEIENPLRPYSENLEVAEYLRETVSEEEVARFREHYTSKESPDYSKSNLDGEYPKIDRSENAPLSNEELYKKFGEDWNSSSWRFEDGVFNEYSTYNPKSKWDWYQVGGRWAGMLKIKEGIWPSEPVNFSWGWLEEQKKEALKQNIADAAKVSDIDFESMLNEGRESARASWNKVADLIGVDETTGKINMPEFTWKQCIEKAGDNIEKARDMYGNQELVKRFKDHEDSFYSNIFDYNYTLEEYENLGAQEAVSTFAVLLDGVWYEKGKMGWFGMSSNTGEEAENWKLSFYDKFIKDLPDNAYITIVDCHI